jgi:hypothetical protein
MTLYSLVLFVHVAAVLPLFAVLSFEVLSLFHLRRASTLTEAQLWIEPVPGLPLHLTQRLPITAQLTQRLELKQLG